MTDPQASARFSSTSLAAFSAGVFEAVGMPTDHAQMVADCLVDADLRGVSTHGVVRVQGYVDQLVTGDVDPAAQVVLEELSPVSARIDGGGTFGAIAGTRAMEWAVSAARQFGIAVVAARNVAHFGAAGYFARLASRQGLIGVAMTNGAPTITAAGGVDARLGNNPLAIAAPGEDDFCLDMAMSVVSRGRVKLAADAGESIPETWAVDPEGRPTTDAESALAGALSPVGGYKGAGLALAVEILSAALTGAQLSQDVRPSGLTAAHTAARGGSITVGHLFLAISPAKFRPLDEVEAETHRIAEFVLSSQTLPGQSVLIPGQPEARKAAERRRQGVPIPQPVLGSLNDLAERYAVEPLTQL